MVFDRLDRQVPHRLGWVTLGRAVPGLLARFKKVPANYWQHGTADATVSCPCGENPCVAVGGSAQCQCGRIYLYARDLYVANSPSRAAAAAVD